MGKLFLCVAVAAAVSVPAAFASGSVIRPDQLTAARACSTLRTSIGPDTFAEQYARPGACARQWVGAVQSARLLARSSCRSGGPRCVETRTEALVNKQMRSTMPAIRSCAAELNLLGMDAFITKHGGAVLQGAFGHCVHPKTAAGIGDGTATGPLAYSLAFTTSPLGGSGVSATGSIRIDALGLVVSTALLGAESGKYHAVLLLNSTASCDALAPTVDEGGVVAMPDGAVLVSLDPSRQSGAPVSVVLSTPLGPFAGRRVFILGATVDGSYDRAYPVACGTASGATG
jgi:hypothetical protein